MRLPLSTDDSPLARQGSRNDTLWAAVARGNWSLYAVYLGMAWVITRVYWQTAVQLDAASIQRFAAGTAEAPFAYRVLMPWVIRWVSKLNGTGDPVLSDVGLRVLVLFALMALLRKWMRHFVAPPVADLSPFVVGAALLGTVGWYWPYDFADIAFWTACLLALVERRYLLYLAVFTVATFNRETTFFLFLIFISTQWRVLGPHRTLRLGAAQLAIFLAISSGLRLLLHPPGGELVEIHVRENLDFLLGRNLLGAFENLMLMSAGTGYLWLLAPWRWRSKSDFLRRACWALPPFALLVFVGGRLGEPRLWNAWLPIVLALSGQTLMAFSTRTSEQPSTRTEQASLGVT